MSKGKTVGCYFVRTQNGIPDLVRRLVDLGIKGFWNFSHYDIGVYYPDVAVENVHLGDSLMTLCYEMQALENKTANKPYAVWAWFRPGLFMV